MKKPSELKRGDIVYTYSDDRRHTNYECIVLRNGHKYIKTDGVIQQDKFDKETMTCVDWSSWHLFPGTKAEYEAFVEKQKARERLLNIISNQLKDLTLGQLGKVSQFISEL